MANWKGYDTNQAKNMNFFICPGKLQLGYYNRCRKLGINPHHDLQYLIEKRMLDLGINSKLEEMRKQRDLLDQQIRDIENNDTNPLLLNRKLKLDVESRITEIKVSAGRLELPASKWLFFVIKSIGTRYDLLFNEVLDLFKEYIVKFETPEDDEEAEDYKVKLLDLLEFVRVNGNNGCLTEQEIESAFKVGAEV
jgi:hypothetical protein